ncbi:MAG: hypothetical protein GY861_20165 [bacterium]|nr:hypothetical protein [bacterium]
MSEGKNKEAQEKSVIKFLKDKLHKLGYLAYEVCLIEYDIARVKFTARMSVSGKGVCDVYGILCVGTRTLVLIDAYIADAGIEELEKGYRKMFEESDTE